MAELLGKFLSGEISNMELDRAFPGASKDRFIHHAYEKTWAVQDDVVEMWVSRDKSLASEVRATLERCALFAQTDLPYEWPTLVQSIWTVFCFKTESGREGRDRLVWPFYRRSDYENARSREGGS